MKNIALVLMVIGLGFAMAADYTPSSEEDATKTGVFNTLTATGAVSMASASISMANLPTATTGLASGRIWANSNVLTVVP
jgi:hypothetical protein